MKKIDNLPVSVMFVASDLSRGLLLLARKMSHMGMKIFIAAPSDKNEKYLLDIPFIKIHRISAFGRTWLFPTERFRKIATRQNVIVHTLDMPANKMATEIKNIEKIIYHPLETGIDLKIWSPDSVSVVRQTKLLSDYNIAPHKKLITIISPLGAGLTKLLSAMSKIDRNDFVIALNGSARNDLARRIVKQVNTSGFSDKIIYIGDKEDLPTVMRASFATMSLQDHKLRMLKFATAMGRPTIWENNSSGITPNIAISGNTEKSLSKAIEVALDMTPSARAKAESENLKKSDNFSIELTIQECINLYFH